MDDRLSLGKLDALELQKWLCRSCKVHLLLIVLCLPMDLLRQRTTDLWDMIACLLLKIFLRALAAKLGRFLELCQFESIG